MSSLFRKPKRNVRQRQADSDDSDGDDSDRISAVTPLKDDSDDQNNGAIQQNIAQIKAAQKKNKIKAKSGKIKSSSSNLNPDESSKSSLLSFDDFDAEADGQEVFRVKKSSQSRKIMKQKKKKYLSSPPKSPPLPPPPPSISLPKPPPPPPTSCHQEPPDLEIRVKDNLKVKKESTTRTLSGYEAEALHMEDEDEDDEEEEEKDPLVSILESGAIPDAAAIHAARKRRQAAREKGPKGENFIPIKSKNSEEKQPVVHDDNNDSGDEDARINMTGVRSNAQLIRQNIEAVKASGAGDHDDDDDDEHRNWEEQQIRKAVKGVRDLDFAHNHDAAADDDNSPAVNNNSDYYNSTTVPSASQKPTSYNLEGIKDRIKTRVTMLEEVHRRHEMDADRIVDELVTSQSTIDECQVSMPDLAERHRFYQDLRGYVTDLVECFDEKLVNIKYVEDKYHKMRGDVCQKIMLRRREDVRDQMKELSTSTKPALQMSIEENAEEANRQRRAAEREGRRRRRVQMRQAKQHQMPPHNDGMSSDDEMSTLDQAMVAKTRQDVENQARTLMADVVEDFAAVQGILDRMGEWKAQHFSAYSDAFVSLCLPKMVAPLVTLQLLFWNPLEEHTSLESMDWYKKVALYSVHNGEDEETLSKDPDRKLVSLVMEKVVLLKIISLTKAAYDPLSTTQTLKLTQLLNKLMLMYPTMTGTSRQVRDLLTVVVDKLKCAVEQDVYIPLGYPKQFLDNPLSGHAMFLSRQFWGCFKLFKNILSWHGLIADKLLVDLALNSLLYRYLLIGLGVTPNLVDVVNKTRHIVSVIPSGWSGGNKDLELKRFIQFLSNLGQNPSLQRDSVKEVVRLLRFLGANEASDTLDRTRLRTL